MATTDADTSETAQSVPDKTDFITWDITHTLAQVAYLNARTKLLKIWKKISSGKELRPSLWNKFVDSKEVWDIFWVQIIRLSHVTVDQFALGELVEEGQTALTEDGEEYFLVPLTNAMSEVTHEHSVLCGAVFGELRTAQQRKYPCQQFIKKVMIFAFAEIHGKPFTVRFKTHPTRRFDVNSINERILIEDLSTK
jgi:hypothetical protein